MTTTDFFFGVEELAVVMSVAGSPEMAHSFMVAQLGDMSKEEARARLLSATHSLLARGWVMLGTQGETLLAEPILALAKVLTKSDFSIRLNRSYPTAELLLSFHFSNGSIYSQAIEQGVVHRITCIQDKETVIQKGLEFFEIETLADFGFSPFEVPMALLNEVKNLEYALILQKLQEAHVSEPLAEILAADLSSVQYRGGTLRVEYPDQKSPQSEKGFLILRGPERLWLLRLLKKDMEVSVILLPGTKETLSLEMSHLF